MAVKNVQADECFHNAAMQPVKTGIFKYILAMQYANSTVSTKMLHAARESLGELINGTAEIIGAFKDLQQAADRFLG